MFCTTLALLLGAAAPAQDEDVYKSLAVGDRVQITFRNKNTIIGNLVALPAASEARQGTRKERTPAEPFLLLLFVSKDDSASQAQEAVLDRWMRRHPEGRIETPARDAKPDLWKDLSVAATPTLIFSDKASGRSLKMTGIKTEVELTEALIQFRATAPAAAASIDYMRENALTLDLSWEYPGLTGTITIPKDQIKSIRKLQALDPKKRKELEEEKKKIAEDLARQNQERITWDEELTQRAVKAAQEAERLAAEMGGAGDDLDKRIKDAEKVKQALELYRRFPPPEWGMEKVKEIQAKAVRKQPISMEEREFLQNIESWLTAREYYEKKKGEKEEKKAPETPAPAPPEMKRPPSMEEKPPEEKNP